MRPIIILFLFFVLAIVATGTKSYTFRCPKSGQLFQFSSEGEHKCPIEGHQHNLTRVR